MQTEQTPKDATTEFITGTKRSDKSEPLTEDQAEARKKLIEKMQKEEIQPQTDPTLEFNRDCELCKHIYTKNCKDLPKKSCFVLNNQISDQNKVDIVFDKIDKKYFRNQYDEAFVWGQDIDKIYKNFKVKSKAFKLFINRLSILRLGKSLSSEALKNIVLLFETHASIGKKLVIHNRVKKEGNIIFVDLCNDKWQAIMIYPDPEGKYEILDKTPPMFARYKHMRPLPLPKNPNDTNDNISETLPPIYPLTNKTEKSGVGGKRVENISFPSFANLSRLNEFLNLNDEDFFLTIVHMVNDYCTDRPQTTMCIHGAKGSGKTAVAEGIRKILDPAKPLTLNPPSNVKELLLMLDRNHYLCIDNLSYLSNQYSDVICRANTGSGSSVRELYTDSETIDRDYLQSVNLNGINVVVFKEDLFDRTFLNKAQKFDNGQEELSEDKKRQKKTAIDAKYKELLPYMLHDFYTLISKTLYLLPKTETPTQFRMMDTAEVGCAVAEALGKGREYFIKIYQEKLGTQLLEAITNNTFANCLWCFMEKKPEWHGSATELHIALKHFAKEKMDVSTNRKDYPSAPNVMSRMMNELKDAFSKLNIVLEDGNDPKTRVNTWTITNQNFKLTISEILEKCRKWIMENKDSNSEISESKFTNYLTEIGAREHKEEIVNKLMEEALLCETQISGTWRVLH